MLALLVLLLTVIVFLCGKPKPNKQPPPEADADQKSANRGDAGTENLDYTGETAGDSATTPSQTATPTPTPTPGGTEDPVENVDDDEVTELEINEHIKSKAILPSGYFFNGIYIDNMFDPDVDDPDELDINAVTEEFTVDEGVISLSKIDLAPSDLQYLNSNIEIYTEELEDFAISDLDELDTEELNEMEQFESIYANEEDDIDLLDEHMDMLDEEEIDLYFGDNGIDDREEFALECDMCNLLGEEKFDKLMDEAEKKLVERGVIDEDLELMYYGNYEQPMMDDSELEMNDLPEKCDKNIDLVGEEYRYASTCIISKKMDCDPSKDNGEEAAQRHEQLLKLKFQPKLKLQKTKITRKNYENVFKGKVVKHKNMKDEKPMGAEGMKTLLKEMKKKYRRHRVSFRHTIPVYVVYGYDECRGELEYDADTMDDRDPEEAEALERKIEKMTPDVE